MVEGYYAHQLGHAAFMLGIVIALYAVIRTFKPIPLPWRYFAISLILYLQWNLITFLAHSLRNYIEIKNYYIMNPTILANIYVFLKIFDPIINVLAIFFFYKFIKSIKEVFV